MNIQDNILKQYLKNIYFVCGTACGGKSTLSRALAEKHGFLLYDADARFDEHIALSDPVAQPSMNRRFASADEFFGRSEEEYLSWLEGNNREQLGFILLDLIRLSEKRKVVCDAHFTPEQIKALTEPERVLFLIKEPKNLIDDYCGRPDHEGFTRFISSASDPTAAKRRCNAVLERLNCAVYDSIKRSGCFYIERDASSTVEHTLKTAEEHFGLT